MVLLGNLHLISDSEYGTHVVYNLYDTVIDFYTEEIEILKIIEELEKEYQKRKKEV